MFRPSLGHPQALKENRSKITYMFYKNALWDPKLSQNVIEVHQYLQTRVSYNLYCTSITFCERLGSHTRGRVGCLRQPTLPLSIRINTGSLYRNVSILNYKRDKDNVS